MSQIDEAVDALEGRLEASLARRGSSRGEGPFKGRKVIGEVFDRVTVHAIHSMIREGTLGGVNGAVSAGKESVVFWAKGAGGEDIALKVYLVATAGFRRRAAYMEGDPRFGRVRGGTRAMVHAWAQKEFRNLWRARSRGVRVPRPIAVSKNVLAMEFIGERGVPARTLNATRAGRAEYEEALAILEALWREAELVHGDLSGYNLFFAAGGVMAFDLGSAVDTRHPMALEFLKRDINNVTGLFVRHGLEVENPADVLARVTR
ncbi:MAG: serine protein kinase RIO [Thaumarchaeota archaeon]|nr:serine protein kinase RIO [Nitrososphaerota archaeon]MDD9812724.1 serine protein kinase RIO [Nitrososphaerota archaeon]MDD9825609.1 serine protein kinase RIO [Nitrososphaerota archaeon]